MGRKARLRAERRVDGAEGRVSKVQDRAIKVSSLLPDYGSRLLRSNIRTHLFMEPGLDVNANYYPDKGFADFHLVISGHCASILVPCEKNQVQAICNRLSNGFSGVLKPERSKAYTTPRTKERVVPVVFEDLPAFMATVDF